MRTIFLFIVFTFFSCSKNNNLKNSQFGSEDTLDIITWNIENFPKMNKTIEVIKPIIIDLNPDIFALQEIENQSSFEILVNELGPTWIGYRSENSDYGEPSYIINTREIEIITSPYQILSEYSSYPENYFTYRQPYLLEFSYKEMPYIIINVHYKCCGDGFIDFLDEDDEEYRRYQSSFFLEEFVNENFAQSNIIIMGDFNDELSDSLTNNIFTPFLNYPLQYQFTDLQIELANDISYFSYPTWPSHLDHILISNELFNSELSINTIRIEDQMRNGWDDYENFISDHRPVGIRFY